MLGFGLVGFWAWFLWVAGPGVVGCGGGHLFYGMGGWCAGLCAFVVYLSGQKYSRASAHAPREKEPWRVVETLISDDNPPRNN